jgi:hypothetical protein
MEEEGVDRVGDFATGVCEFAAVFASALGVALTAAAAVAGLAATGVDTPPPPLGVEAMRRTGVALGVDLDEVD